MTTHRFLQVYTLLDVITDRAKKHRRAASNLARINNFNGAMAQVEKAQKCDSIAFRCSRRLSDEPDCDHGYFLVKDDIVRCYYCGHLKHDSLMAENLEFRKPRVPLS